MERIPKLGTKYDNRLHTYSVAVFQGLKWKQIIFIATLKSFTWIERNKEAFG